MALLLQLNIHLNCSCSKLMNLSATINSNGYYVLQHYYTDIHTYFLHEYVPNFLPFAVINEVQIQEVFYLPRPGTWTQTNNDDVPSVFNGPSPFLVTSIVYK